MDLRAITDLDGGRLQTGKLFGRVGPICQSVVGPLVSRTSGLYMPFRLSKSSVLTPLDSDLISRTPGPHFKKRNADQHTDPGLSVTRRQVPTHAPAAPAPPPSAPADGRHYTLTRHKDRGDLMYRLSKGKRSDAAGHGLVSHVHDEESDLPFVPHRPDDPPVHHPFDPYITQPAYPLRGHAASRATHIVPHPVR